MWPAWSGGLLGSGVLTQETADALDALSDYVDALEATSWTDDAATLRCPVWAEVRRLASHVRRIIGSTAQP
jgi:hypothetical protein